MTAYLLKRCGQALVVLLIVSMVVFALTRMLPGDTARAILGPLADKGEIAKYNTDHGFDKPLPVQYGYFLRDLAHGDLGDSYRLNRSVTDAIGERLLRTLVISGIAVTIAALLAIPLGMIQASRRNRVEDHVLTVTSFVLYSMPPFWLALILITVFSVHLGWLPPQGPAGPVTDYPSQLSSLVLPIVTMTCLSLAYFTRYVRSSVLDNLVQDYVLTARSKGLSARAVLRRHVLRNAVLPLITLVGLSLPYVFGGAIIVEKVFNVPGMGLLFWDAATGRDYPVLVGVVLVVSVAAVVGSLLADVLYAVADPRIREGSGHVGA
jgi:peptide/nickel transport system permease protein